MGGIFAPGPGIVDGKPRNSSKKHLRCFQSPRQHPPLREGNLGDRQWLGATFIKREGDSLVGEKGKSRKALLASWKRNGTVLCVRFARDPEDKDRELRFYCDVVTGDILKTEAPLEPE